MADGEGVPSLSKKRIAGREISRDNPGLDDDDKPEPEMGTFQRASEEVLASRRIVKVRRTQQQSDSSSNPFVGINLVAPPKSKEEAEPHINSQQPVVDEAVLNPQDSINSDCKKIHVNEVTERGPAVHDDNATEKTQHHLETESGKSPSENDPNIKIDSSDGVNLLTENDKETEGEIQPQKDFVSEVEAKNCKDSEKEDRDETSQDIKGKSDEVNERVKYPTEEDGKQGNGLADTVEPTAPLSSFQQLSNSTNAFTGIAGTGFSGSSFSFGSMTKEGSPFGATSSSFSFGEQGTKSVFSSFGLGSSSNGNSSLSAASSDPAKAVVTSKVTMQEVPIETGEENEKVVFHADAILFEYLDVGWKERGKGEVKVNVSTSGSKKPRLVMRARGNYRLILNASLYPEMSLKNMDKRGVTFSCVNSAGDEKSGFSTFALKFKDSSIMEEFRDVINAYKGKEDAPLKTPENSPKASDD